MSRPRNPKNPFCYEIEVQEQSLDSFISEMCWVNKLSWKYNPWYCRLANYLVSKIPSFKRTVVYDESYIGFERRNSVRIKKLFDSGIAAIKVILMTKTEIIPLNEDEHA